VKSSISERLGRFTKGQGISFWNNIPPEGLNALETSINQGEDEVTDERKRASLAKTPKSMNTRHKRKRSSSGVKRWQHAKKQPRKGKSPRMRGNPDGMRENHAR